MKDIKILVATHKKYKMPKDDIYLPIHVGRENKEDLGYIGDNTGENISIKNPNYCELTGLYWAWKNVNCEIIGLAHYRRYFLNNRSISRAIEELPIDEKFSLILKEQTISQLISNDNDIILPKKRNYYIETIWSHYKHAHNINDLQMTMDIIKTYHPSYLESFNTIMSQRKLHLFNMFVMKKSQFDKYCEWLFDILGKLEENINIENYNPYQARVFGFISERLFNVWVLKHKFNVIELDVMNLEKEDKLKKYVNFLYRKLKAIGV